MASLDRELLAHIAPWNDPSLPVKARVDALIEKMTLREKVAQLYGVWVGASTEGDGVAPHQNDLGEPVDLDAILPFGLGQLTRSFGTNPIDAAVGAASLARIQERIRAESRFGIPAIAHEECLAGFTTWGATAYPVPLSWGATFDPGLIAEMGARIGSSMRSVGVHQGLAPVLDVTVDPRWGRTEETIGEDPYLVGVTATAYVTGIESAGIVATLKHFAGYSASRGARNLAPTRMGAREFADVVLAPFEMAIRESGVRSVMHAYTDTDGVPSAADGQLLTGLLRETWGFTGTVVADYFGIGFLKLLHGVADTWGDAGAQALTAGVDVELPTVKAYAEPLIDEVAAGRLDEGIVDRAVARVLAQKIELGLLDPDWSPLPEGWSVDTLDDVDGIRASIDLDPDEDRAIARRIAEEAVVLLHNDGLLPLTAPASIAVIGPTSDDVMTMLGCYSFPNHVGTHHPELPLGIEMPTVLDSIRGEFAHSVVTHTPGCAVDGDDSDGIADAVAAARDADVVVLALGDRAGLFGRGTSGEGCDAETLRLPGVQAELLEAVLDANANVVVTVVSGRPYALGTAPQRASAIVQAFFPGEEGGSAIAGVLSGRVNPSGRLPVSIPAREGGQPWTYLGAQLSYASEVSNIDPTPAFGFGSGRGYTEFSWSDLAIDGAAPTATPVRVDIDGAVELELTVRNTGSRAGTEVVQLYVHDPVASVTRPVVKLVGFTRVELEAGHEARVRFSVPTDVASFTGRDGARIVEPGALELRLSSSSLEPRLVADVEVVGATRTLDHTRRLHCEVAVEKV